MSATFFKPGVRVGCDYLGTPDGTIISTTRVMGIIIGIMVNWDNGVTQYIPMPLHPYSKPHKDALRISIKRQSNG